MPIIKEIWDVIRGKPNPLDAFLMKAVYSQNAAIYPNDNAETYLEAYTGHSDFFTIINKIVEPASTVPVFQYDSEGEIVEEGKMLARLNKPNGYQSRSQFIEGALTYYYIFGNCYTAFESLDNGINKGIPLRLDILPPQWISIVLNTMFDPVKGYSFFPLGGQQIDYPKEKVFHWKEFNPDYNMDGGHLKGMSRLRPLIKSITGGKSSYDALVTAFQNMGAWGILTMLGEEGKGMNLSKQQASELKNKFRADQASGKMTVTGALTSFTKMGLTIQELQVLGAVGLFKGNICDAFNVPNQLLAGSTDRTYNNYREAEAALWRNAIQPSLDAYLEGLSNWLAPLFGEEGTVLRADYSEVSCLQTNKAELVAYMTMAQSFSRNEIREACGYEMLDIPGMDEILISAGLMPIAESGLPPEPDETEEAMEKQKLSDYRK